MLFETGKQKALAVGVGAVAGLTLLGGVAFAQTPGGTATPSQPAATATATPDDGSGGQHKDGKDCPHDYEGSSSGSSSSGGA